MAVRIVHLSDLHLPARNPAQASTLQKAINALQPALVVVTGDVTRAARISEFAAASTFFAGIAAPLLAVPGNHDVPVFNPWQRIAYPYARFRMALAQPPVPCAQIGDVQIVGFNTAYGLRLSADWSLGWAKHKRVEHVIAELVKAPAATVRIVACHHPLLPDDRDPYRSRTMHGPGAFAAFARAGMTMLLHGHLHRDGVRAVECDGRTVQIVGAGTALSDRERDHGTGFNLIEAMDGNAAVTAFRWNGTTYST